MVKYVSSLLFASVALAMVVSFTGCGPSRPDPRKNPDFNEEALKNPSSVKMGPTNIKTNKK